MGSYRDTIQDGPRYIVEEFLHLNRQHTRHQWQSNTPRILIGNEQPRSRKDFRYLSRYKATTTRKIPVQISIDIA